MSWSVQAMGKGEAVGRELERQFSAIQKMAEPEQSMKDKTAEIAKLATEAAPESGFIVRAEGHQYRMDGAVPPVRSMHLKVEIDLVPFAE